MSKAATQSFRYSGGVEGLRQAVLKSCDRMKLNLKEDRATPDGFQIKASEGMKWLTTNWPVTFEVTAESAGEDIAVLVSAGTAMFSLTQDFNNSGRAEELAYQYPGPRRRPRGDNHRGRRGLSGEHGPGCDALAGKPEGQRELHVEWSFHSPRAGFPPQPLWSRLRRPESQQ